jgi:hypothetical protein
LQKFDAV